jgi:hypothetical protein
VRDLPGGSTRCATRPKRARGFGAAALALALGCTGSSATRPPPASPTEASHSALAEDDREQPPYGAAELSRALISERGAEATAEHRVTELEARPPDPATDDQLRVATADLAVRRRFLVTLEACQATGAWCPPRLDDPAWTFDPDGDRPGEPPVTATLRFDLDSWRTLAAELDGRACACRTQACVDSVGAAIDLLELRPVPQVRDDDAATASVTRARECLFRLRGKVALRAPSAPPAAED